MDGLFETIRVRQGRLPFLDRHLARLEASLAELNLRGPQPGLVDRIRLHASGGDLVVRVTLEERGERIETRAAPESGPMRIVFSGTRYVPYPHKSTDRKVFDRARSRVVPYRADEVILFADDGTLAEGCVTSVFFWHGDILCTPSLDIGILPGIGRSRVLDLARGQGIGVREGRFSRAELEGLPLFLTNAVRGVVDTTIHGRRETPGDDRTRRIAERFWG